MMIIMKNLWIAQILHSSIHAHAHQFWKSGSFEIMGHWQLFEEVDKNGAIIILGG